MRDVLQTDTVVVPKGVTASVEARIITIEGPRGKLVRDLHHISMDIRLIKNLKKTDKQPIIHLAVWNGVRKHVACLRTIKSAIQNMIKGVTQVSIMMLEAWLRMLNPLGLLGILVQDAFGLCAFPDQLYHSGWREGVGDPEFPGREGTL